MQGKFLYWPALYHMFYIWPIKHNLHCFFHRTLKRKATPIATSWNCTGLCQDYVVQLGFVSLRFQKSWPRHLIFLSVRPLPSHSGDMGCWGGICQQLGKSAFPIGLSDFSKNGWVSLASAEEGNDTYTAARVSLKTYFTAWRNLVY